MAPETLGAATALSGPRWDQRGETPALAPSTRMHLIEMIAVLGARPAVARGLITGTLPPAEALGRKATRGSTNDHDVLPPLRRLHSRSPRQLSPLRRRDRARAR